MSRFVSLCLCVGATLLVGCGQSSKTSVQSSSTAPRAAAPVDGTPLSLKEISMTMPKDWVVVDLTNKEIMDGIEKAWASDPKLAPLLPQVKGMVGNGSIKAMGFERATIGTGFATNLNVIVLDQGAVSLDKLVEGSKLQLKSVATGPITDERLKGKNCDLGLIKWSMKNAQGDLSLFTVVGTKGTLNYTISFTTLAKSAKTFEPIVKSVAGTIELK